MPEVRPWHAPGLGRHRLMGTRKPVLSAVRAPTGTTDRTGFRSPLLNRTGLFTPRDKRARLYPLQGSASCHYIHRHRLRATPWQHGLPGVFSVQRANRGDVPAAATHTRAPHPVAHRHTHGLPLAGMRCWCPALSRRRRSRSHRVITNTCPIKTTTPLPSALSACPSIAGRPSMHRRAPIPSPTPSASTRPRQRPMPGSARKPSTTRATPQAATPRKPFLERQGSRHGGALICMAMNRHGPRVVKFLFQHAIPPYFFNPE